jgi:hypothetical protein
VVENFAGDVALGLRLDLEFENERFSVEIYKDVVPKGGVSLFLYPFTQIRVTNITQISSHN